MVVIDNKDTWWRVKNVEGEIGYVPANYLDMIGQSDSLLYYRRCVRCGLLMLCTFAVLF